MTPAMILDFFALRAPEILKTFPAGFPLVSLRDSRWFPYGMLRYRITQWVRVSFGYFEISLMALVNASPYEHQAMAEVNI